MPPDLTRLGVVNSVSAMELRILLELHVVLQLQKYATDGIYHMPTTCPRISLPSVYLTYHLPRSHEIQYVRYLRYIQQVYLHNLKK